MGMIPLEIDNENINKTKESGDSIGHEGILLKYNRESGDYKKINFKWCF